MIYKYFNRFLITSLLISIKYLDDNFFNNDYFAKIGGLKKNELNSLEDEFLNLISYSLFTTSKEYNIYYNKVNFLSNSKTNSN